MLQQSHSMWTLKRLFLRVYISIRTKTELVARARLGREIANSLTRNKGRNEAAVLQSLAKRTLKPTFLIISNVATKVLSTNKDKKRTMTRARLGREGS